MTAEPNVANYKMILTGSNHFGAITQVSPSLSYQHNHLILPASTTTYATSYTSNGTSSYQNTLASSTTAAATLSAPSGINTETYTTPTYITATGGAIWNALVSAGNVDGGNNSGWGFYAVTPSAGSHGSVSPNTATGVATNGTLAITATPDTGYSNHTAVGGTCLAGSWTGNVYTTGAVSSDCTATFTFDINQYTLTYTAGANGSITGSSPQTVNYGASGSSVTAVPATGYHFTTWSDSVVTAARTDTNITANLSVTATFAINTYTVTPSSSGNGTISPSSPQTVNYNATTAFTITPDSGYGINTVSGCGGSLVGSTYTTGAITGNCTVTASFTATSSPVKPNGSSWLNWNWSWQW